MSEQLAKCIFIATIVVAPFAGLGFAIVATKAMYEFDVVDKFFDWVQGNE